MFTISDLVRPAPNFVISLFFAMASSLLTSLITDVMGGVLCSVDPEVTTSNNTLISFVDRLIDLRSNLILSDCSVRRLGLERSLDKVFCQNVPGIVKLCCLLVPITSIFGRLLI